MTMSMTRKLDCLLLALTVMMASYGMYKVSVLRKTSGNTSGSGTTTGTTTGISKSSSSSSSLSSSSPALFDYAPTRHDIDGVEAFSKFPSSSTATKGVVLLFHGCDHNGVDWFTLPEERIIVRYLVEHLSMGVVAFSSYNRESHKCWSKFMPPAKNIDAVRVAKALPQVIAKHQLPSTDNSLPYYGIGASSGGHFVSMLHEVVPLRGMEIIVSAGNQQTLKNIKTAAADNRESFPKIFYVSMSGDKSSVVGRMRSMFLDDEDKVRMYSCRPKPVTAEWLSQRIESLSLYSAALFVQSLAVQGIIDASTGELTSDPRRVAIRIEETVAQQVKAADGSSGNKESVLESIRQELNVAWAEHENTSEYIQQVFEFFLAGSTSSTTTTSSS